MWTTERGRRDRLFRDTLGWGVALWLVGYILGIILFFILPASMIGWFIMPVGVAITLWVLLNKIDYRSVWHYAILSVVWTAIALGLDYGFIVKLLSPQDGYYKLDVYLYYVLTFLTPLAVGVWRSSRSWTTRAVA